MRALARRMESKDLEWVVSAIDINRETGGNLSEILGTVSATIRERQRMARHVRTLTAEGRLSARILTAMPLAHRALAVAGQPGQLRPADARRRARRPRRRRDPACSSARSGCAGSSTRSPCDGRLRNGTMNLTVILGAVALVGAIGVFWWGLTARPVRRPRQPLRRAAPAGDTAEQVRLDRAPARSAHPPAAAQRARRRTRSQARAGRAPVRARPAAPARHQDHPGRAGGLPAPR